MAEIAEGVHAAAGDDTTDLGKDRDDERQSWSETGTVATFGKSGIEGRPQPGAEPRTELAGPTFERLVREVLTDELRRWVDENLERVAERVVREEIRMMGRRRPDQPR